MALIKVFNWFKRNSRPTTENSSTKNYRLTESYGLFENVLDNTLKFIDAYLSEKPSEWLLFFISTVGEKSEFSTDSYRCYEEFIEFKVSVGSWHDYILHQNKDAKDYMMTVYNFDSSENDFTYRMKIAESTNRVIDSDVLVKKLFDYIDTYEKNNPNRKLTRTSYGIHNQWNL